MITHITGTRARDIAEISAFYGFTLISVSYEEHDLNQYKCVIYDADKPSDVYDTRVTVSNGVTEHVRGLRYGEAVTS